MPDILIQIETRSDSEGFRPVSPQSSHIG